MRLIFSCCLVMVISISFTWAQEMKVTKESANVNIEEEGKLLVQPKSEMTIEPKVYQAYKASQMISFRAGVRIRPTNTGWFSAQVSEVSGGESAELLDTQQMDVFPNPVENDFVHVRLGIKPEVPWSVKLFSMDGKEIDGFKKVTIDGVEAQISLHGLPQGIYLLKALVVDQIIIVKVIKK